jgi:uronate dehydrogenase
MRMIDPSTDRVMMTGAAGLIGSALREHLRPAYRHLRLTDMREIPDPAENEECIVADITDRPAMERTVEGCKALVHLAGLGGSGDLEALFRANVRGLFDVFEAARLGGIERIVFASSNHAFGCYGIEVPVSPDMPPRPDGLYGAFKVWGEVMLRAYYERHGIASVSLRIGTYRPLPIDQRSLATWLSPRDVSQLVDLSLRHPDPGCLIVNGYSGNTRIKAADSNWAFLAYGPLDNAEDYVLMLREMGVDVDGPWEWNEHGGSFAHSEERPARLPSLTP